MTTEALIRELVVQAQPVRPLGHPLARFGRWAAFATAWVVAAVAVIGVRIDVATLARDPLNLGLPVALAFAATGTAFLASVPDRKSRWSIPGAVMAVWLLLVLVEVLSGGGHAGVGVKCIRNLVAFSVPPAVLLYYMLRRAAPLDGGAIGLWAALGVAAMARAGTRFVCHHDGALHILVWHCGFMLLLGGLGCLIGRATNLRQRTS